MARKTRNPTKSAKPKTWCGRRVPKPTDADSTELYIQQQQAIAAGEQAWKDDPTRYGLIERTRRIRRDKAIAQDAAKATGDVVAVPGDDPTIAEIRVLERQDSARDLGGAETVRVETKYTLRGKSSTSSFEIAATPRAGRRRVCSEISGAQTVEAAEVARGEHRAADGKAMESVREVLESQCARIAALTAPEERVANDLARGRSLSMAAGMLSSVKVG